MSEVSTATVVRTVTVPVAPAAAFALFTERLGDFKPPEHNLLSVAVAETVLEPRAGGGIIDRGAPCYGEDNEWLLTTLLGMSRSDVEKLAEEGVI